MAPIVVPHRRAVLSVLGTDLNLDLTNGTSAFLSPEPVIPSGSAVVASEPAIPTSVTSPTKTTIKSPTSAVNLAGKKPSDSPSSSADPSTPIAPAAVTSSAAPSSPVVVDSQSSAPQASATSVPLTPVVANPAIKSAQSGTLVGSASPQVVTAVSGDGNATVSPPTSSISATSTQPSDVNTIDPAFAIDSSLLPTSINGVATGVPSSTIGTGSTASPSAAKGFHETSSGATSGSSVNGMAIAGAVVGGIVLIIIFLSLGFFIRRRRRLQLEEEAVRMSVVDYTPRASMILQPPFLFAWMRSSRTQSVYNQQGAPPAAAAQTANPFGDDMRVVDLNERPSYGGGNGRYELPSSLIAAERQFLTPSAGDLMIRRWCGDDVVGRRYTSPTAAALAVAHEGGEMIRMPGLKRASVAYTNYWSTYRVDYPKLGLIMSP
ncbi:hypothetical protein BU17DRAFT_67309 [Hysterangium stoloniferum]|nr:hypothetical protein BU17DRAFT_67309 [Hysterangium stoloniferum]